MCLWSGQMERSPYEAPWMQVTSDVQSGYLPPIPDFANPVLSEDLPGSASYLKALLVNRDCQVP